MHQEKERAPKDLERIKVIGCCRGKTGGGFFFHDKTVAAETRALDS